MKRRKMIVALSALLIWILGNAIYVLRNRLRMNAWEEGISREADGRMTGSDPFLEPAGSSTALLMVHGYANSPDVWRPMLPSLKQAGISCKAIQLPGFMVPAEVGQATSEAWLDTVQSAYDELKSTHETVWVMGHSLGCGITLAAVNDGRIDPAGLVFFAPLIKVSSARSPVLSSKAWHHIGKGLLFAPRIMENVFPPDVTDAAAGETLLQDRFIHRSIHDSLFRITSSLPDDAAFVKCPMLVFLAPEDKVVDVDIIRHYIETATGEATQVDTPQCGHVIPIDTDWEKHLETAIAFIQQAKENQLGE